MLGLFLALAIGCSENQIVQIIEEQPNISIEPALVDFGALDANNQTKTVQVKITNLGTAELDISPLFFEQPSQVFSFTQPQDLSLQPQEHVFFPVTYDPVTYSFDQEEIEVHSNDSDSPNLDIILKGEGGAPVIFVEPNPIFFIDTPVGCEEQSELKISNIGNVDLQINSLDFFVSYPTDIELDSAFSASNFPWFISPGDSVQIPINYFPKDEVSDSSFFKITSNDPLNPLVLADQFGEGFYSKWITDGFEKSGQSYSDILFIIDDSCSMAEEQSNMALNFNYFINSLTTLSVDFHIGVITTTSPIFRGAFISNSTLDPVSEFSSQIMAGTAGSSQEKGLEMAYLATGSGGQAAPGTPFFREDAFMALIFISDEEDQSYYPVSFFEHYFHSLKRASNMIIAHAVAGDYPFGCSTAVFGAGYYDFVNSMFGEFLSICSPDWGVGMELLATQSTGTTSFELSQIPIQPTIKVFIDGVEMTSGWRYESSDNFIQFLPGYEPLEGQYVEVKYAVPETC